MVDVPYQLCAASCRISCVMYVAGVYTGCKCGMFANNNIMFSLVPFSSVVACMHACRRKEERLGKHEAMVTETSEEIFVVLNIVPALQ